MHDVFLCYLTFMVFVATIKSGFLRNDSMKKNVLITGASRGIGAAAARAYANAGYNLILTCHTNADRLLALRDKLVSTYSIDVTTHVADISKPEEVDRIFDGLTHLDVLINNAGISYVGLLHEMSIEDWHRIMDTNLSATFYTCRRAVPLMLKSHSGKILNVSSVWGQVGASMEASYCASKAGLNGLTMALAKELAPSNIQVNAVACGLIATDMNSCFSKEELDSVIDEIPADRIGTPEEVAELLLQLGNSPAYLTGQVIRIDGGWI